MIPGATVPSIPYIAYSLFKFISNHPLIVNPVVKNPITEEVVPISVFQFMHGFPTEEGLICSIYPGYQTTDNSPASPTSTATSTLFRTHDLGHNHDEAIYHFVIEFMMREVSFPGANPSTDKDLITVPVDALTHPDQRFFVKQGTREVPLYLNPPMDIIGDYLEITRLALNDVNQYEDFPINVKSIEVIHSNYNSTGWDQNASSIVHTGYLYLRLVAYTSRGWRDKFILPLEKINLDYTGGEKASSDLNSPIDNIIGNIIEGTGTLEGVYIPMTEKGAALGVATLDGNKKIPLVQLPDSVLNGDADYQVGIHNNDPDAHPFLADLIEGKQDASAALDSITSASAFPGVLYSDGTSFSSLETKPFGEGLLNMLNPSQARSTLELGSASLANTSDFASALQGSKADTALQPSSIGTTVQAYSSNLDSLSGLSTTVFGRSLLTQADAAATRTTLGLGSAALSNASDFASSAQGNLASTALQPGAIGTTVQPYDADLTSIAALTTTTFGRNLLTELNASTIKATLGLGSAADYSATDFQLADADLTAIAGLTTTAYGRGFLTQADGTAGRAYLSLGTAATTNSTAYATAAQGVKADSALQPSDVGTTVQGYDSDLASIAGLSTTAYGRSLLTQADAAATRSTLGLGTAALSSVGDFQPADSDLTAIAGLSTTVFGRSLLTQLDAAATRSTLGLGTAATTDASAYATAAQGTLASSALQPAAIGTTVQAYDADLAAIALLSTTPFGRSLLTQVDAPAARTTLGLGTASTSNVGDFQPVDADLTAIASLTTTAYGRSLLTQADAAATRTTLGLGSAATTASTDYATAAQGALAATALQPAAIGTTVQAFDSDLASIAALTTTAFGRGLLTQADAAATRTALGLGSAALSNSGDFQPVDADLTAIAGLATTVYGRSLLTQADASAARSTLGLGTAATTAASDYATAAQGALAATALQPAAIGVSVQAFDSDLASIASLTTTVFGRSLLTQADAAATRTTLGLGTAALNNTGDFQPVDSDLTAIAALTTTSYGRSLLTQADAAATRTTLGLGTAATTASTDYATAAQGTLASTALQPAAIGTTVQAYDADLANIASLTTTAYGRSLLTQADASATRTTLGLGTMATQNANAVNISSGTIAVTGTPGVIPFVINSTNALATIGETVGNHFAFEYRNNDDTKLIYQDFSLGLVDFSARLLCSKTIFAFQGDATMLYRFDRPVSFALGIQNTVTREGTANTGAFSIYALSAGTYRWAIGKNGTAESGSNAGSDFGINAYDDAGNFLFAPFSITRATGQIATRGLIIHQNGSLQTTGVGTGSVAGNARGTGAIDLQVNRAAATQVASGSNSFIAGGFANTASGAQSIAMGGTDNIASGANSVCIGNGNLASNSTSVAIGQLNQATQQFSTALNLYARTKRYGEVAIGAGRFAASNGGDAQTSILVVRGTTTDATPLDLVPASGFITLDNDSTVMFQVNVAARRTDADNESAAYVFRGCIDRNANAASTALVGSVEKTVLAEDTAAWDVNITADTTNGALRITATGEAAKNIRWLATCYLTEIVG